MDIEQQVVEAFRAQGLTPERLGEAEYIQALRREVAFQERRTAEPMTPVSGSLPRVRSNLSLEYDYTSRNPRDYECNDCEDASYVLVRSEGRKVITPCLSCTTTVDRMAWGGVDIRFRSPDLDGMVVNAGNRSAIQLARDWDGTSSVVLASRVETGDSLWGTGKTRIGCALLEQKVNAGIPVRFISVIAFLDGMKSRFDSSGAKGDNAQAFAASLAAEPILMIDDLGAERGTDWAIEQMRALIDSRYRRQRTTIITTNLDMQGIYETYGGAVASRMKELAWWLVGGPDYRGRA